MNYFNERIEKIRENLYELYKFDPPEQVKRHLDDAFLSVSRMRYTLKDVKGEGE